MTTCDDDDIRPHAVWLTMSAATALLGRRPGDADCDPASPLCIRSRLDTQGRRWWLAEDVQDRAKAAAPAPVSEQARVTAEIFARWARDAARRRERLAAVHAGVSHG